MAESIMPEIKIVDPMQHLRNARDRTGAFLSSVWNAGRTVELCLSEHRRDTPKMGAEGNIRAQANEVIN